MDEMGSKRSRRYNCGIDERARSSTLGADGAAEEEHGLKLSQWVILRPKILWVCVHKGFYVNTT